jgi:rhombotail lipoprotein
MRSYFSKWQLAPVYIIVLLVAGCASTQSRYYSSTVDFLYPNKKEPVEKPAVPVMKIPIKVGIAFVPDAGQYGRSANFWQSMTGGSHSHSFKLIETQKAELMKEVADHFRKYPFIGSIEIIPSAYLKPQGSFANLDQIRTMYGVDAIALLAVDQVQFTDEGAASFLYWTIIGAYTIPGEKNTTNTMMDAVVYDIKSRKMLFRAPGLSEVKGNATPVNISKELRKDSNEGFQLAVNDMIKNLDEQLGAFKEKIKASPKEYKVVHRPGYHGGGGFSLWFVILLLIVKSISDYKGLNRKKIVRCS